MGDSAYMARALALAERGRGRTSPNPMVGALVVDDEGVIAGRGAHEATGEPHAEIHALADAGSRARGATLYCTLEPCSHTGRTGPCAPRVVEAGIRRAVIAIEDPNPLVAGRGIAHLRASGIEVEVGVGRDAAARQNRPFFTRMTRGRPFVTIKIATSLDGYVAAAPGARTALTGPAANRLIHRERAEIDAIAVGSGTVLADDPLLTARGAYRHRPLVRVAFDRRLRTPPTARLFSTMSAGPVIIVSRPSTDAAHADRAAALIAAGARIEVLETETGRELILASLTMLATAGVNSLLVEGGPALHRAFLESGAVDRVELFITPKHLGPAGLPWMEPGDGSLFALAGSTATVLGDDVLIEAYVHGID